jgi:hypothetical protein
VEHDVRTMRFNDGKCDALGRFWGGTLNEAKDRANAALYCFDARSDTGISPTISQMANESTTANGLAFSPDARTLYWADTAAHVVCAWDWDAEANALSHARVFQQFDAQARRLDARFAGALRRPPGRRDGIDAQGHYWVAMFEGAQLLRFSPSGDIVASIATPVQCPTMPCFRRRRPEDAVRDERPQGTACGRDRTAPGVGHGDLDAGRYAWVACQLLRGLRCGVFCLPRCVLRLLFRAAPTPTACLAPRMSPASLLLISLRKAHHRRERYAQWSLISCSTAACPGAQGIGCFPQRNKGGAKRRGTFAEGSTRCPVHTPCTTQAPGQRAMVQ